MFILVESILEYTKLKMVQQS